MTSSAKTFFISARWRFGRLRSSKVIDFLVPIESAYIWDRDFLLYSPS